MAPFRLLTLEVERKFSRLAVQPLTLAGGHPPFRSLRYLGLRSMHDIYYDLDGLLSSKGIWVRKRDGDWEAKIKDGGNFQNSRFMEMRNPEEISRHLKLSTGISQTELTNFGLRELASFTTFRQSWVADDDFTIVQDTMDFDNHMVGEVELQCTLPRSPSSIHTTEEERALRLEEMDSRIRGFMTRYAWAFHVGQPKGKLAAFLERLSN
ncbi:hypothetical protein AnigIFM60653_001486 [Aspergillus niger]|nr:hypothetical protein CBS13152_11404 [Aspergillus niger]KAI2869124.1 hypothetical protein CBS11852_11269 [Aspergillus niger]KAI2947529.1 hypothetical protein CBS147323_11176 [Aspergillus niger]KAI3032653.1 hypothetical protein CBS76997_11377 [Aspergillus niger]GKZ74993.1 hypothetical protein AnigIFM50267_001989 [Aspergillus niger]